MHWIFSGCNFAFILRPVSGMYLTSAYCVTKHPSPRAHQLASTPIRGDFLPVFIDTLQITLLGLLSSQKQWNWETLSNFSTLGNEKKPPLISKEHFACFFHSKSYFALYCKLHTIAHDAADTQSGCWKMGCCCCYHYPYNAPLYSGTRKHSIHMSPNGGKLSYPQFCGACGME